MAKWNTQSTQTDLAAFSDDPTVLRSLRRRKLRIFGTILVVGLLVFFAAKPTYRWLRKIQIDRNLEAAKTALRLEDWGTARNKARSVLIARSGDFEAYKIWHKALAEMGEPRTYMVAAQLFMDPRSAPQDRLDALGVMARQAPQAVALSAFASLSEEMRKETSVRAAIAPLFIHRGAFTVAEMMLREAPELESSPPARLELLRLLCAKPSEERIAEARTMFAQLINEGSSSQALEALVVLGDTPGGLAPGKPLPKLPEWVETQPAATTLHHLLAQHPAIEATPESSDAIFDQAIERFLGVDPGTIGSWLIRHNKSERAVRILSEPAKTSGSAYIARLHALLREKQTDQIAAALQEAPDSVDLVDLELAKAAAARIQADSSAEINAWNEALNRAAFDQSRNRFIEIGRYAETLGASAVVEDAWVAAVRIGWGQIPLYRDMDQVFASLAMQGRSDDLLAMYRTLLRFEPQNPELINNFYYLALLHQVVAPSVAAKALEELVARNPDKPEFRSALAMALLMDGKPQLVLQQLPEFKNSKRVSPLMYRALEGCALVLRGDTTRGQALLVDINWRRFMRHESLAFRDLLMALQINDLPLPDVTKIQPATDLDQIPAWRKAVERLEKQRAHDVLPALPVPIIPGRGSDE